MCGASVWSMEREREVYSILDTIRWVEDDLRSMVFMRQRDKEE